MIRYVALVFFDAFKFVSSQLPLRLLGLVIWLCGSESTNIIIKQISKYTYYLTARLLHARGRFQSCSGETCN